MSGVRREGRGREAEANGRSKQRHDRSTRVPVPCLLRGLTQDHVVQYLAPGTCKKQQQPHISDR